MLGKGMFIVGGGIGFRKFLSYYLRIRQKRIDDSCEVHIVVGRIENTYRYISFRPGRLHVRSRENSVVQGYESTVPIQTLLRFLFGLC